MKSYILVAIIFNCIYHGYALEERNARAFSLFNVVKFRNTACQATSSATLKGTCYTAQECSDKKGTADGNCASSFGVCCVIRMSTCGSAAKENCTFIESPSYPAALPSTTKSPCAYTVTPSPATDICQIRLDFTVTVLTQPEGATGKCSGTGKDSLTIKGGDSSTSIGVNPPVLCGTLSGQHLYVDSGKATTAATITFALSTIGTQKWRIKVSQMECGSKYAPPNGCLQWFMGNGGTVTSFNWDGTACTTSGAGCFLENQDYSACFKQEKGMCGIQYAETKVTSGTAFDLENGDTKKAKHTLATCVANTGFVGINPKPSSGDWSEGAYCGDFLTPLVASAAVGSAAVGGAVTSNTFDMRVWAKSGRSTQSVGGFSIDYTLLPC